MDVYSQWFSALRVGQNYNTMHYYAGTGTDSFDINFAGGYIDKSHVKAVIDDDGQPVTLTFVTPARIRLSRPVPVGNNVLIFRDTPKVLPLAMYSDGALLNASNMDRNAKQAVFVAAEMLDRFDTFGSSLETSVSQVSEALRIATDATNIAKNAENVAYGVDSKATDALVAATEANKVSRSMQEALYESVSKSYREQGYTVVPGSFEAGGELTGPNDVLIHMESGVGYTGNVGTVLPNTVPSSPEFTKVNLSTLAMGFRKTNTTLQGGGVVSNVGDVVKDSSSGMWYEWTGEIPHKFTGSISPVKQSYRGWICRGLLTRWQTNDPRNFGAHSRYELGFLDFDSTDAIQLMVDAQRLSLPNSGANYTLDYTSRQLLDFNGMVYNVSRPISCQDDVITGHRASGLKIVNGGLRALPGFTGQKQISDSSGNIVEISAFLLFGVRNYATQSGQWQSWSVVDNFSFDGNGFKVDEAIYTDVSAYCTYSNIKCRQVKRGWRSKVLFLSKFSNWQLNDCNGIYQMVNTSISDGYNGGRGLEGGGNTLDGLTITGDGNGDQSINRMHQDRIGEITCSNVISYNGLGDFLVVTADSGSASGTKWSRWKGIEVGDLGGRVLMLKNASYLDIELTVVKCGRLLGNKSLCLADTCSYVHITPMIDQFYDLPSAWSSSITFMDCVGCRVNSGTVRSIPHADNTSYLISFLGSSVDCSVADITTNLGSYTKRYVGPVYSESTCVNTSVSGGTFLSGVFINPMPKLNGTGDNFTGVNVNGTVQDSARNFITLQSGAGVIAPTYFEYHKVIPYVGIGGAELAVVEFLTPAVRSCLVDVHLTAVTTSGMSAYSANYKAVFTRTSASTGVVSLLQNGGPITQGTSSTVLDVKLTEEHTQYKATIKIMPSFAGSAPESACSVSAVIRVSSTKSGVSAY